MSALRQVVKKYRDINTIKKVKRKIGSIQTNEIIERWENVQGLTHTECKRIFCASCGKTTCHECPGNCVNNKTSDTCKTCFKDIANH